MLGQLLRNMGTIDQPWVSMTCFLLDFSNTDSAWQNCPHGRPTMRHLTKLNAAPRSSNIKGRFDWTRWKDALG